MQIYCIDSLQNSAYIYYSFWANSFEVNGEDGICDGTNFKEKWITYLFKI